MFKSIAIRYIVNKFTEEKLWLCFLLFSGVLSGLFEPLLALSMKKIVDGLSGSDGSYLYYVFAIPVLGVVNNLCWRLMEYIQKERHVDIANSMVVDMFMHYLKRGSVNGERDISGSVSDRINAFQGTVLNISGFHLFGIIRSFTILLISFSVSFYISPIYGLFSIIWLVFVSRYIYLGNKKQSGLSGKYSGKVSSVAGYMTDTIYNISLVKSFGGMSVEHKNICDITKETVIPPKLAGMQK